MNKTVAIVLMIAAALAAPCLADQASHRSN